jgi:hypothetical protein
MGYRAGILSVIEYCADRVLRLPLSFTPDCRMAKSTALPMQCGAPSAAD